MTPRVQESEQRAQQEYEEIMSDRAQEPIRAGVKERPILFSGAMVRAILEGRKTMTRRVVKPQPPADCAPIECGVYAPTRIDSRGEGCPGADTFGAYDVDGAWGVKCPYGKPGDRLWVRETFCMAWFRAEDDWQVFYRADSPDFGSTIVDFKTGNSVPAEWRPSIHMPRKFSRITLEVCSVRVERVQEISPYDCIAEGMEARPMNAYVAHCLRKGFAELWDSINAERGYSWDSNPLVWCIEFRRVEA